MKELDKIIKNAIKGSSKAFEELCILKGQSIVYWCVKIMGNLQDGEDAAQEVFIRLQKEIVNLKNPDAFNSWSYLLVRSTCNNLRRKNMKDMADFPIEDYEDIPFTDGYELYLPQDIVENEEKRELFLGIINKMPVNMRMSLILFYYDGFSRDEIATALDIPPNTVKVLLYRGRLKLKKEISILEPEYESTSTVSMGLLQDVLAQDVASISANVIEQCVAPAVALAYASAVAGGAAATAGTVVASSTIGSTLTAIASVLIVGACVTATMVSAGNSNTSTSSFPTASNVVPQQTERAEESMIEDIVLSQEIQSVVSDSHPIQSDSVSEGSSQSGASSDDEKDGGSNNDTVGLSYTVSGKSYIISSERQLVKANEKFPSNMQVLLLKNGKAIAQTKTDKQGSYIFENLSLQKGEYQIKVSFMPEKVIQFASPYEDGKVTFSVGDNSQINIPDIFAIDSVAPSLAVTFYDAKSKIGRTNPVKVVVDISDITETSCKLYIYSKNSDKVLLAGSVQEINEFLESSPAKGTYTLKVVATDVAQNNTIEVFDFYIV